MATAYKETYTKPLPDRAELFTHKGKRFARWTDGKGKKQTEPVTKDGTRLALRAGTYTAKYRDGQGIVRKVSTGCRDETAAGPTREAYAAASQRALSYRAERIHQVG